MSTGDADSRPGGAAAPAKAQPLDMALESALVLVGGLALLRLLALGLLPIALVWPRRVPQGTTVRFMDMGRDVIEELYTNLGHPPAWPVNWLFAARHGVSPDRFDDLYGGPSFGRVHVQPGSEEARSVLATGWTALREPTPTLWATGREARMIIRLGPSAGGWRLYGQAAAAADPNGRSQSVDVAVNGRLAGKLLLHTEPTSWTLVVPAALWKDGLNDIRFEAAWTLPRGRGAALDGVPHFAAWRLDELKLEPAAAR